MKLRFDIKTILFGLLAFLCLRTGFAQSQSEIIARYSQALAAQTLEERIAILEDIVRQAPDFLEAKYALGASYYEKRNFKAAIPYFEEINSLSDAEIARRPSLQSTLTKARLDVKLAAAYNVVGMNYLESHRADSAIANLRKAIKFKPDEALFYYNLGNAYIKQGNYPLALEAYQHSLRLENNFAPAWINAGAAYWYLDRFGDAVDAYKKGLELDPGNSSARANLKKAETRLRIDTMLASVDSAMRAENPDFAITIIDRIKQLDPAFAGTGEKLTAARRLRTYQQAVAAKNAGDTALALQLLSDLPATFRNSASLRRDLQRTLQQQEERETLDDKYSQALRLFEIGSYEAARRVTNDILRIDRGFQKAQRLSTRIDSALAAEREALASTPAPVETAAVETLATPPALAQVSAADSALMDTAAATAPPILQQPQRPVPATGKRSLDTIFLIALSGIALALLIGLFLAKRKRNQDERSATMRPPLPANRDSGETPEQEVSAAVARVNFDDAGEKEPGTQELFENLIHDNGSVEILEIIEDEKSDSEGDEAALADEEILKSPANTETEAFLSLLDEDENQPGELSEDDSRHIIDKDVTRTVDMSQFKVRKIGRYIIEKEIGRGAAGRIYKAWDQKLDRTVVIKTVSYSLTASEEEIKRMKARVYREARSAAKLNHPNIVVVYDVEDEPTYSYIVMEHIEGQDLRELLDREKKIAPGRSVNIIMQVCKALQFAHNAGIVHRDIKPSNVLMLGNDKVKVTDFGIAKVTNHLTLTQTGRVVGTPSYMAPEQIEGSDVDGRADIFSLGVVFYELLTGQRPFIGETLAALAYKIVHTEPPPPSLINVELPNVYDDIINKAMAKDPNERYQDLGKLIDDLQKVQALVASKESQ